MKGFFVITAFAFVYLFSPTLNAQTDKKTPENLYIDVHHLGAGKVTAKDAQAAHEKDLATEKKYGVKILKYWFDEKNGDVYCLSYSPNKESILKTHAEAHGLMPSEFYEVTSGQEEKLKGGNDLYLDVHRLGAGNVNAKAAAEVHKKDLAVEKKHGVNLINYWVDEKNGTVMCLAQAPNGDSLVNTHKEAHGMLPESVVKVKQGQ